MGATGTATLDFGAFPGKAEAFVDVTGQTSILGTSLVEAWIVAHTATTDHSKDEHVMAIEQLRVIAGPPTASTGFRIYGQVINPPGIGGVDAIGRFKPPGPHRLYGQFKIGWAWL